MPTPDHINELLAPKKSAPTLLPAYLDLWTQTSPEPAVVPDVSLFLHGPDSGPPDVQVVWRTDLLDEHLDEDDGSATAVVEAVRPSSLEAVAVPFAAARSWLAGEREHGDFADVERSEEPVGGDVRTGDLALRWRGEASEVIDARGLRPGDTIVVPSLRGGLSDGSFDPSARFPVADLAERATLLARGRPVLRVHPAVLRGLLLGSVEDADDVPSMARAAADEDGPSWRRPWLSALTGRLRRTVVELAEESWTVVEGHRLRPSELRAAIRGTDASVEPGADTSTDEEDSFHAGRARGSPWRGTAKTSRASPATTPLFWHFQKSSSRTSLSPAGCTTSERSTQIQSPLRGGDEVDLLKDDTAWAKSAMSPGAKQAHDLARKRSRYPRGARHEVQSVAMIEAVRDTVAAKACDVDLVLHLVGSHHGYCRPFAPPVVDDAPVEMSLPRHTSTEFGSLSFGPVSSNHGLHRLDSPLADRFWSLVERYGWLELCWLEAILRRPTIAPARQRNAGTKDEAQRDRWKPTCSGS